MLREDRRWIWLGGWFFLTWSWNLWKRILKRADEKLHSTTLLARARRHDRDRPKNWHHFSRSRPTDCVEGWVHSYVIESLHVQNLQPFHRARKSLFSHIFILDSKIGAKFLSLCWRTSPPNFESHTCDCLWERQPGKEPDNKLRKAISYQLARLYLAEHFQYLRSG